PTARPFVFGTCYPPTLLACSPAESDTPLALQCEGARDWCRDDPSGGPGRGDAAMMTVHVLHAGDGYSYLTRQVATHDVSREQGKARSDYYMQHGNPPGQWVGRGLDALGVAGTVREDQMRALFGEGLHAEADRLTAAAIAAGKTEEQAVAEVRLG